MRHNTTGKRVLKEVGDMWQDSGDYDYLEALDDPTIQAQIQAVAENEARKGAEDSTME